jgi:Ca2+:H+ antiporter
VLPNYTRTTLGPSLSSFQMVFLSVISIGIYGIFLYVQNRRHRGFFISPREAAESEADKVQEAHQAPGSMLFHGIMLGAYGVPLVMLAKQMAVPLDATVHRLGAPVALGGFVTAVLVLTPESIAAVRAARENKLQRSVNILLGSVLASIGLTIPLVLAISLATGRRVDLGLDGAETVMLVLSLVTATLTFSLPRTNVLLGCVHLLLFCAYFMLMFDQ